MARQTRQTLRVLEQEIPETAATLRLGGLELSDCIEEMSGLRCSTPRQPGTANIGTPDGLQMHACSLQ